MRKTSLQASTLLLPLLTSPFAASCASEPSSDEPPPTAASKLDYHRDAKAVLERYCTNCHQAGGIAPFALTDYAAVRNHAPLIKREVESGKMPPWLPGSEGLPLRYARNMRPEDKKLLLEWIQDGAREGDAIAPSRISIPVAELPAPPRHDLVLDMGTSYQPNQALSDDYRCFVIEPGPGGSGGLPAESYMQAGDILPGSAALVHHVIVYEIPAALAAEARNKDASEPGPGYTCFGGPGVGNRLDGSQMVMGWAPGGTTMRLKSDEGVLLRKGSIFVVQLHYNLSNYTGQSDRTVAHMELAASPPAYQVRLVPLANPQALRVPAGDADATQMVQVPVAAYLQALKLPGKELTIITAAPHMHLLGTKIVTSLDNQVLIDISKWDFHWQQAYFFAQPVVANATQNLLLECHYDNSASHQPMVNGMPQQPRDVTWGEGTLDEMCLSFLGVRFARNTP